MPTIAKTLESWSSASLSRSRKRIRWYAAGAIRKTEPAIVQSSATMYASLWSSVTSAKRCENGTASRKAKSTCTPGSATRSSLRSSISSRLTRSSCFSGSAIGRESSRYAAAAVSYESS